MIRLPDFLIVGAMKSGTTTLYRDLLSHPRVFFPVHKELRRFINLTDPRVLSEPGRAEYGEFFAKATKDQLCGEASTIYTKRPDFEGAARQAHQLIGPGLKIFYILREPIDRIISQYHHEVLFGFYDETLEEAVVKHPALLNYSRYAMQLEPWMELFGRESIRVIRFEDYMADRHGGCASALRFLGLDPDQVNINPQAVYNRTQGKPLAKGWVFSLTRNRFYRDRVRPVFSAGFRDRLRHWLLPKARSPKPSLSADTVASLIQPLQEDQDRLAKMLGLDEPLWDLRRTRGHETRGSRT